MNEQRFFKTIAMKAYGLSHHVLFNNKLRTLIFLIIVVSSGLILVNSSGSDEEYYGEWQAQSVEIKDVGSASLLYKTDEPGKYLMAPVLRTEVELKITGIVLRGTIRQRFLNKSESWVEGIYVFPLPENSAVDYMKMIIGERIIEGQIKERAKAKQIYETAKKEGKKASLVEQERPNIFTTSVANIAPGEEISIEIQYQQDIRYDSGKFSLRFPMVIGPRYIPGTSHIEGFTGTGWAENTDQVPDAQRITPPVLHPDNGKINPVTMNIELNAGFALKEVKSLYPGIDTRKSGDLYMIKLSEGETPADKDFVLEWEPEIGKNPNAALFTEEIGDYKYQLLMVMPPDPKEAAQRIPRESIFVIDKSGSMDGTSIRQAKKALLKAIDQLQPEDSFNIIEFNHLTSVFFNASQPATAINIEDAKRHVEGISSGGGTEMLSALRAALANQIENGRIRQVIFITDGSIGNENELFAYIKKNLGRSRLFTVGIGSAPNSFFMTKAAEFGKGTFTYIGDISEVEVKMNDLFNKLENPYLSDIKLHWQTDDVEIFPATIPDLYKGQPILVSARLKTSGSENLEITGKRGESDWKVELKLRGGASRTGIDKLWARKKIEKLMDSYHENNQDDNIRDAVLNLALEYHLVSKFTSLVAVDITPSRPDSENLQQRAVPVNLPDGWKYESVFGTIPQTGTDARFCMLIGLILTILALIIKFRIAGNR